MKKVATQKESQPDEVAGESPDIRRFTLKMNKPAYEEMATLSRRTNHSMSELIRYGLAVVQQAYPEIRKGNKLVIADRDGHVLKEFLLPM
jgi:hypothetical protein